MSGLKLEEKTKQKTNKQIIMIINKGWAISVVEMSEDRACIHIYQPLRSVSYCLRLWIRFSSSKSFTGLSKVCYDSEIILKWNIWNIGTSGIPDGKFY